MENKDLRAIIKLVRILRENGVRSFEGSGIKVVIGEEIIPTPLTPSASQTKTAENKAIELENVAVLQENADVVDDQIEMLLIEDPAEFEGLVIERELEDAGTEET